jgi:hypothetical protein
MVSLPESPQASSPTQVRGSAFTSTGTEPAIRANRY